MAISTFRWLDHDAEQARRSAELVRALAETETLDSLGIGAVRDGIAGVLFPGTSTIQTRVRYFLLVPWALQQVAGRKPRDKPQYDRWLRDVEVRTIRSLIEGNTTHILGIIGRNKGADTKRLASSVYWNALAEWGVRVAENLTLSGYRELALSRRVAELLDGEAGGDASYQVWDEMPSAPEEFPDTALDILPTADEAEYLLAKMAATRAGGLGARGLVHDQPSLLSVVAEDPLLADLPAPWAIPGEAATSPLLRDVVRHARAFSLVIQGARLRYVQLLFEAQARAQLPQSDGQDVLDELVTDWTAQMDGQSDFVSDWVQDMGHLYEILAQFGVPVGGPTRAFIANWCTQAVSDPTRAMQSPATADLVREREGSIKSPNARLVSESALRAWDGSLFGSRPLDYRWGIASQMVLDCSAAIEIDHASS